MRPFTAEPNAILFRARIVGCILPPPLIVSLARAVQTDLELPCRHEDSERDVALVRRMGAGDPEAAQTIYERYSTRVFRYLYRRVSQQAEDAEDLTLETFVSAVKLAKTYLGESSVFGWLCGIAKLRLTDFYRKRSAEKRGSSYLHVSLDETTEDQVSTSPWSDDGDPLEELNLALRQLSGDELEVLTLRFVEGLSSRDTAAVMKRSERAIESLLSRAKAKVRAQVGGVA